MTDNRSRLEHPVEAIQQVYRGAFRDILRHRAARNRFNCTGLHLPSYDNGPFTGHAALHTMPLEPLQELPACVEINS